MAVLILIEGCKAVINKEISTVMISKNKQIENL